MRPTRLLVAVAAAALAAASPAGAHHVLYLDFSQFSLASYASVNGLPPTAADANAVQQLIVEYMSEDYAPFDVHVTTFQPPDGRYTRVRFLNIARANSTSVTLGCAGLGCCAGGSCTGIGSWDTGFSSCEVYAASFPLAFGVAGTWSTIANAMAVTASHEAGHVIGLHHCTAADDSGHDCVGGVGATQDQNLTWHVMGSGTSTGVSATQYLTQDFFFSVHSSRRALYRKLQPRNHWAPLGNYNAGLGRSDLTYGWYAGPTFVQWSTMLSNGSSFGTPAAWSPNGGDPGDVFLTGDVTGDGRDDLVRGTVTAAATVQWTVHPSSGTGFAVAGSLWSADAGNAGDIFRLGDVDGDGRDDLVYGRAVSAGEVTWFARLSTGSAFGPFSTWHADAGNRHDLFLLGDVTGDGRDDLVAVERGAAGDTEVYRSTGSAFTFDERDSISSFDPEYVLLGDADGDGRADLITGQVVSRTRVDWDVRPSNGCGATQCFLGREEWAVNAGDSGDLFRIGDGDGDGRADLFYARPIGMTSLTAPVNLSQVRWFGRLSTGSAFDAVTTWASDAGNEGDVFP